MFSKHWNVLRAKFTAVHFSTSGLSTMQCITGILTETSHVLSWFSKDLFQGKENLPERMSWWERSTLTIIFSYRLFKKKTLLVKDTAEESCSIRWFISSVLLEHLQW